MDEEEYRRSSKTHPIVGQRGVLLAKKGKCLIHEVHHHVNKETNYAKLTFPCPSMTRASSERRALCLDAKAEHILAGVTIRERFYVMLWTRHTIL